MSDALDAPMLEPVGRAKGVLDLVRRSHSEYIRYCELIAPVLLVEFTELDGKDLELAVVRIARTMMQLNDLIVAEIARQKKLRDGLSDAA